MTALTIAAFIMALICMLLMVVVFLLLVHLKQGMTALEERAGIRLSKDARELLGELSRMEGSNPVKNI